MANRIREIEGFVARQQDAMKEARAKIEAAKEKLFKLRDLPALKEKYKGKFFKYENSFSFGEKWWLYFNVLDVISDTQFRANSFQTDSNGDISIRIEQNCFESSFQTEITPNEYCKALRAMKENLSRLSTNVFSRRLSPTPKQVKAKGKAVKRGK